MSDDYGLISRNRQPRFYTKAEVKPMTSAFVSRGSPDYPAGTFLTPLCLTSDQARQLLSAAWQGAELLYGESATEVMAPLLQALEYVDDPSEAACMPDVYRYRIFECKLQESADDGVTWSDVPNGGIDCVEDGRTPELRQTADDGCVILEWKYTDEPPSAWRPLGTVCNGSDGREIQLRSIVSPTDDDCRVIQWRYAGEAAWVDLATVCDGDTGLNGQSGAVLGLHIGLVLPYTGTGALPSGLLDCDGATYARTAYPALYDAIAPVYRIDANNFRVPDLRGRTVIGTGTGSGLTARAMDDGTGAESVQLTEAQLPAHEHTLAPHQHPIEAVSNSAVGTTRFLMRSNGTGTISNANTLPWPSIGDGATGFTGNNQAHPNMQPSRALRYVIVAALPEVPAGEDGRTPEFRSVEIENDCRQIQWKYTDEGTGAWRNLTVVCDGDNGICPDCEDDDTTPPPDDDDKPTDDPPGTPDGKTARCKAAHNISEHVEDVFQELLKPIVTGAVGLAVGVLAKKIAVAIGIKTFGVGFALGIKIAKAVENLTSEAAFDAAFPDSIFETGVKCDIYCTIGADGQYNESEYPQLLSKLSARGGSYEVIRLFLEAVGYQQANWYATFTDDDPYTCADCDCEVDPCEETSQNVSFVNNLESFCWGQWVGDLTQFPAAGLGGANVSGATSARRELRGWRKVGNGQCVIFRGFETPFTLTSMSATATLRDFDGSPTLLGRRVLSLYVQRIGVTGWQRIATQGFDAGAGTPTHTASFTGSLTGVTRLAVVAYMANIRTFWIESVRFNE